MAQTSIRQRFDLDIVTDPEDRLVYVMMQHMAYDGHGDVGMCGVAEFDLIGLAEAVDRPPGETLRRLKRIAQSVHAVCVEHENLVLFAMAGASQEDFAHLYKSRGFVGMPPNLPRVKPRFMRI